MFSFSKFYSASTLQEAYDELLKNKKNIILGGTSYLRMENTNYNTAIDLSNLSLSYIREEDKFIHIGAMTSFRDVEVSPIINNLFSGVLSSSVEHIIGVQFRNNVTVGATVFSKYGFSDLIPALLTMETTVVLFKEGEISLEDYLAREGKTRDILVEIKIKKVEGKGSFQSIRKSKTDYAITNAAVTRSQDGFRVAVGVRPSKAVLAYKAMEILNSADEINEDIINKACEALNENIPNITCKGVVTSAVSKVLVKKAIMEVL